MSSPAGAAAGATTATIGKPMHLALTATGYPTPTLTESGTLPRGLRFTSAGHGHAAITGTPAPGTAGGRAITITAATNRSVRPARPLSSRSALHNPVALGLGQADGGA